MSTDLSVWAAGPPSGAALATRSVVVGGHDYRLSAHPDLVEALGLIESLLRDSTDRPIAGDVWTLPWGDLEFEDRGDHVRVLVVSSLHLNHPRRGGSTEDLTQLVWVWQSWRAVERAASFGSDVSVHAERSRVVVSLDQPFARTTVEVRRVADPDQPWKEWVVGTVPLEETVPDAADAAIVAPSILLQHRPDVVPALCLPAGWRALVTPGLGIRVVSDADGRIVFRAEEPSGDPTD